MAAAMPDPKRRVRCASLQVRQHAFDLANGGIVRPAVAVAAPVLVVRIPHERARHVDRRDEAARGVVGNAARLGGDRLRVEAFNPTVSGSAVPHRREMARGFDMGWHRLAARPIRRAVEICCDAAGVGLVECAKAHANPP